MKFLAFFEDPSRTWSVLDELDNFETIVDALNCMISIFVIKLIKFQP